MMKIYSTQLKKTRKIILAMLGTLPLICMVVGIYFSISSGRRKPNVNAKCAVKSLHPVIFQYGVIDDFINGSYLGELSVKDIKLQGGFGLGAPNQVDGELTYFDGKAFQSRWDGKTEEAKEFTKSPFSTVTDFKADTSFTIDTASNISSLYQQIERRLRKKTNLYAISIKGTFEAITTRAFEPVRSRPFRPLAQLMSTQHLFNFKHITGNLIGFYMPKHLSGVTVDGLHFHFLSKSKEQGGHAVAITGRKLNIEIQESEIFCVQSIDVGVREDKLKRADSQQQLDMIEKGVK